MKKVISHCCCVEINFNTPICPECGEVCTPEEVVIRQEFHLYSEHPGISFRENHKTFKTNLVRSLNTEQDVEDFYKELLSNNECFHPEDSAADVFSSSEYSIQDIDTLDSLVSRTFEIVKDPCELILRLTHFDPSSCDQ